ncbi:2-oxoglutarate-Fe(II) type oxidoreductase hxnY [Bienertia sinuspersici]
MGEASAANLPIIDLLASDKVSTAATLRKACIDVGFFYIVNHGIDKELLKRLFEESERFFALPLEEKMKLKRKEVELTGYTPLYSEKLDHSLTTKGDPKESINIGPLHDSMCHENQWPSEELLPNWRPTIEEYHRKILSTGKSLLSLLALSVNLDEGYFENLGALDPAMPMLRLLHYPGDKNYHNEEVLGASAHSDYGMLTILATDGVPGLQVCREKDRQPRIWQDVLDIEGALIVNIGDMFERLTNCLFRSTLHRVLPRGTERYSVALFLDIRYDFTVECLETCCSESNPPRFPPIRVIDYLKQRFELAYGA